MKHFFYLPVFLIILLFACDRQTDDLIVKADIEGLESGSAVLKRRVNSEFLTLDSTTIDQGNFILRGKLDHPEMCYIYINDTLPYIRFFAENKEMAITGQVDSLREVMVKGSAMHDALESYNRMMKPYDEELRSIYQDYSSASLAGDTAKVNEYESAFNRIADEQKATSLSFVEENTDNVLGPYLVWGTLAYDLELNELAGLADQFAPEISGSIYVQQIRDYVNTLEKVAIGQPFTEISLPGPEGKIRKLSELKGKVILIDFWASWCGPCRRENPNVVAMYNDLGGEDFEIFGVSLDEKKENWLKAIEEDELTWVHVSDLKGWNSEAGKEYGVRSIPHTVLIDANGIIVDKNLRGELLRQRVEGLLNKEGV